MTSPEDNLGNEKVAFVEVTAQMSGVEFSTLYLARWLDRGRWTPLVICPTVGDLPRFCREAGIAVAIVPRPHLFSTSLQLGRHYLPNPAGWLINLILFLVAAFRLQGVLRKHTVSLVCTKGLFAHFYGGLAAKWAGLPCVWHVQDLVSGRAGSLYARILGQTARRLANEVIVDGSIIKSQLAPFVRGDRLTVIYNGVDTDTFSPQVSGHAIRAEWGVQHTELLIGNVARLTPWKGQEYLVRAFAALAADFPGTKLALVGTPVFDSDTYERHLRSLVENFGLEQRVIFAGYRWDLPHVLAALDVFVHTSIEKDTSPLSVVSAMAAGKAIISTATPGVAELFGPDEAAYLVPVADVAALTAALRELLPNPERRTALGHAARRKAEKALSLPEFARQCEARFDRVLAECR